MPGDPDEVEGQGSNSFHRRRSFIPIVECWLLIEYSNHAVNAPLCLNRHLIRGWTAIRLTFFSGTSKVSFAFSVEVLFQVGKRKNPNGPCSAVRWIDSRSSSEGFARCVSLLSFRVQYDRFQPLSVLVIYFLNIRGWPGRGNKVNCLRIVVLHYSHA